MRGVFLYWSKVVRLGDQIDTTVNLSQLPNLNGPDILVAPARLALLFKDSRCSAHGQTVGLELR